MDITLIFKTPVSFPEEANLLFNIMSHDQCPEFRWPEIFVCKMQEVLLWNTQELICEHSLMWEGLGS